MHPLDEQGATAPSPQSPAHNRDICADANNTRHTPTCASLQDFASNVHTLCDRSIPRGCLPAGRAAPTELPFPWTFKQRQQYSWNVLEALRM